MVNKKKELIRLLRCSNLLVKPKEKNKFNKSVSWWRNSPRIFPINSKTTVKDLLFTIETTTQYLESTGCYKDVKIELDSICSKKPSRTEDQQDSNLYIPEIIITKELREKNRFFGSISLSTGKNTFIETDIGIRNVLSKHETFQSKLKIGHSIELENRLRIPFIYNRLNKKPEYKTNTIKGNINIKNTISKDKKSKGIEIDINNKHNLSFINIYTKGISENSKYELNYEYKIPLYTDSSQHTKYKLEENILDTKDNNDIDEGNLIKFGYNKSLFKMNIHCKSYIDKYYVHYKLKQLLINKAFFYDKTYLDFLSYLKLSIGRKSVFDELILHKEKNIKLSLSNKVSWNIENTTLNIGNVLKKIYIDNDNVIGFDMNKIEYGVYIKGGLKTRFGVTRLKFDMLNFIKHGNWESCFTWELNK